MDRCCCCLVRSRRSAQLYLINSIKYVQSQSNHMVVDLNFGRVKTVHVVPHLIFSHTGEADRFFEATTEAFRQQQPVELKVLFLVDDPRQGRASPYFEAGRIRFVVELNTNRQGDDVPEGPIRDRQLLFRSGVMFSLYEAQLYTLRKDAQSRHQPDTRFFKIYLLQLRGTVGRLDIHSHMLEIFELVYQHSLMLDPDMHSEQDRSKTTMLLIELATLSNSVLRSVAELMRHCTHIERLIARSEEHLGLELDFPLSLMLHDCHRALKRLCASPGAAAIMDVELVESHYGDALQWNGEDENGQQLQPPGMLVRSLRAMLTLAIYRFLEYGLPSCPLFFDFVKSCRVEAGSTTHAPWERVAAANQAQGLGGGLLKAFGFGRAQNACMPLGPASVPPAHAPSTWRLFEGGTSAGDAVHYQHPDMPCGDLSSQAPTVIAPEAKVGLIGRQSPCVDVEEDPPARSLISTGCPRAVLGCLVRVRRSSSTLL